MWLNSNFPHAPMPFCLKNVLSSSFQDPYPTAATDGVQGPNSSDVGILEVDGIPSVISEYIANLTRTTIRYPNHADLMVFDGKFKSDRFKLSKEEQKNEWGLTAVSCEGQGTRAVIWDGMAYPHRTGFRPVSHVGSAESMPQCRMLELRSPCHHVLSDLRSHVGSAECPFG